MKFCSTLCHSKKSIENYTVNIWMPHRANYISLTSLLGSHEDKKNMANIILLLLSN